MNTGGDSWQSALTTPFFASSITSSTSPARLPSVAIAARGTVLHGALIAQERYFAELVEGAPLMAALSQGTGVGARA